MKRKNMLLHLDYITDEKGNTKSVVIPSREWKKLQDEFEQTKNKLHILLGIQDALNEVRQIQRGKKKGKSLAAFLNEL